MDSYLKIFSYYDNEFTKLLLDGIEEQGIKYKVIKGRNNRDLFKGQFPFNIFVEIHKSKFKVISTEIDENIILELKCLDRKKMKLFGLDIGRYIKGLPLKGDFYE